MFPVRRLVKTVVDAKKSQKMHASGTSSIEFRCTPWDLDMFAEMNNGRVLMLYDLGRINFAIRIGLDTALRKNKWGLVVAGSTVRYRNRIRAFDTVTLNTRIAHTDERWVYIEQSMWVGDKPCSHGLLRVGVTEKGKVISTAQAFAALGLSTTEISDLNRLAWAEKWIDSDDERPWPPFFG